MDDGGDGGGAAAAAAAVHDCARGCGRSHRAYLHGHLSGALHLQLTVSRNHFWRNMAESKKNQVKASELSLLLNVLKFAQAGMWSQKECRILRIYFG